jgi:hypothetical protein
MCMCHLLENWGPIMSPLLLLLLPIAAIASIALGILALFHCLRIMTTESSIMTDWTSALAATILSSSAVIIMRR